MWKILIPDILLYDIKSKIPKMDKNLINQLNKLNTNFYNSVAVNFDDSRQYFWQGWDKIPPLLNDFTDIRVADIGCGNGRFGQFLLEKCSQIKLSYTGIDANQQLLDFAKNTLKGKIPALHLNNIDIISAIQNNQDFLEDQEFHLITSFGVFHHIPEFELRLKILKYLLSKLSGDGLLIISLWQFMDYPRFRKKIIKNQSVLNKTEIKLINLEDNDYILDWNRGESALRYCHFIDKNEQQKLIQLSGAKQIKSYRADGKEGDVNEYVVLSNNL